MTRPLGAVQIAHRLISEFVPPGSLCIDATAGRGYDTLFLCRLVREDGKVLAFDIQEEAVQSTRVLLEKNGLSRTAEVYLDSHVNMDAYVKKGSVSCIVFNLGWLPGGDHRYATKAETTIVAIEKGLELLTSGGLISICLYSGKDSGFTEKESVLVYLKTLDHQKYTVIVSDFYNRPNYPPLTVFIFKD